jgi:hypothetical protein
MTKQWLTIVGLGLAVAMLLGGLFLLLWANDVRQDRKHTVLVNSPTIAYAGTGSETCEGNNLTVIRPGTTLHVRRIRKSIIAGEALKKSWWHC